MDIEELRMKVLDSNSEIPLARVALDEDGEPRFPSMPFEFIPVCWAKYITRTFSIFLRVRDEGILEIPVGFTDYKWVQSSNFRLTMLMYRRLLVDHPDSTSEVLHQLQEIQLQMTKEMFGQIPRFKQLGALVKAAEQIGDKEPELKIRIETMLSLATKLYRPLSNEKSEQVVRRLRTGNATVDDDHLLTILQLAANQKNGVAKIILSQKQVAMRLCYFFMVMLLGALASAEAEEWVVERIPPEEAKEAAVEAEQPADGDTEKNKGDEKKLEGNNGNLDGKKGTKGGSTKAQYRLIYSRVGLLFPSATERVDLDGSPAAVLKGPSKKGRFRLLLSFGSEQGGKKEAKVLWTNAAKGNKALELINALFKKGS
jgi:hypothetical protein